MIKRLTVWLFIFTAFLSTHAQVKGKDKNYQGLLWEISGNGLQKPSYLFGTMHVSSKLVFHLADSFYLAIRQADVVALETNPESWQEDMSQFDFSTGEWHNSSRYALYEQFNRMPNDYLSIHTLEFGKYEKQLAQALYSNPSTINNLLYRTYGDNSADFEEDTYLDMYIYQVGKKMGKRVAGVENYGESMRLMAEAYNDAAKDQSRKEKSYDLDNGYSADKMQEAYRTGNLDLLDSLNKLQSFSAAFDEKFLYRRNEIQAHSMDSILKTGSSLFAGVGAAHLPGARGVIELLRQKGYTLRPVLMSSKENSRLKDMVEKIRVPVSFHTVQSADHFFSVDVPGKLYPSDNNNGMVYQAQYADMANGSYYMVTRVKTNNVMWGHTPDILYKKLDSLLYENIPGKILSKKVIERDGYKGLDIINRTRRGDFQRYHIFITSFELLFFKMSGNSDYVKEGDEADHFFNSIRLEQFSNTGWIDYTPSFGGFSVRLPHQAIIGNDGSWLFDAADQVTNTFYRVVRTDIHNYHFAGTDTFDLRLLQESFASSVYIDKLLQRRLFTYNGYPALDCRYRDKDGSLFLVRFIIQGPHYYTLVAHGKKILPVMTSFLNSFRLLPFVYGPLQRVSDSAMYYAALQPVSREIKKEKISMPGNYSYNTAGMDDEEDADTIEKDALEKGVYRNMVVANDSTGEEIFVSFYKSGRYRYIADSSYLRRKEAVSHFGGDSSWIIRRCSSSALPDGTLVWDYFLSDTGSSRQIHNREYYRNGISYSVATETDTVSQPSIFVSRFFETFTVADSLPAVNPFVRKSDVFFADFFSKDSAAHKLAVKNVRQINITATDLPMIKKAIHSLSWQERKYMDVKKIFISRLASVTTNESADFLKELYYAAEDTIELQYAALKTLLEQQTTYAMQVFGRIVAEEPPVFDVARNSNWADYPSSFYLKNYTGNNAYSNRSFWDELYDSLQLTKTILPQLLPLMQLDDYKWPVLKLLGTMADSGVVTVSDYDDYFKKIWLETRLELKKQVIAEKKKAIDMAGKDAMAAGNTSRDKEEDTGNENLTLYATLLLPFYDINKDVPPVIKKILESADNRLRYSVTALLLRKNKSVPDSLLNYFASNDDYRYELYTDLKESNQLEKFPAQYNTHIELARSKLIWLKQGDKPDSLLYINRLPATYEGYHGYVYFFRYKQKKDDDIWRIASVGLVPEKPSVFSFDDKSELQNVNSYAQFLTAAADPFTDFSDVQLTGEEPVNTQLQRFLKMLLYSTQKSARAFYDRNDRNSLIFSQHY